MTFGVEAGRGSGGGPGGYLVVAEPTGDGLRGHRVGGGDVSEAAFLNPVQVEEDGSGRSGSVGGGGPAREPGSVEAPVDGGGATAEPGGDLGGRPAGLVERDDLGVGVVAGGGGAGSEWDRRLA